MCGSIRECGFKVPVGKKATLGGDGRTFDELADERRKVAA